MKEKIQSLRTDTKIRYLIVGGSSAGIEYVSFIGIDFILRLPVLSNVISFIIGFLYSFALHKVWSFQGSQVHRGHHQFIGYAALATVNVLLSSMLIYVFIHKADIPPNIAKIICMALVTVWNYLIMSHLIFGRTSESNPKER